MIRQWRGNQIYIRGLCRGTEGVSVYQEETNVLKIKYTIKRPCMSL